MAKHLVGLRFVVHPGLKGEMGKLAHITPDLEINGLLVAHVDPSWSKEHPSIAAEALNKAMHEYECARREPVRA